MCCFAFKSKKLSFTLVDFIQRKVKDKIMGVIQVRIKVVNEDNVPVFDATKRLNAVKKDLKISIPFNQLKKGGYQILIEATDLFTKKKANVLNPVKVK